MVVLMDECYILLGRSQQLDVDVRHKRGENIYILSGRIKRLRCNNREGTKKLLKWKGKLSWLLQI